MKKLYIKNQWKTIGLMKMIRYVHQLENGIKRKESRQELGVKGIGARGSDPMHVHPTPSPQVLLPCWVMGSYSV